MIHQSYTQDVWKVVHAVPGHSLTYFGTDLHIGTGFCSVNRLGTGSKVYVSQPFVAEHIPAGQLALYLAESEKDGRPDSSGE